MGVGFKAEYFDNLASIEENNFWFVVRNQIILWAINKYSINLESYLEIGCGTGFVTQAIADKFPNTKLTGSEYLEEGLAFARKRLPKANFIQLDARNMSFESKYTMIGAFDVLEHIKEDDLVLTKIHSALAKDGRFFLTVPQHKWLWSHTDEHACHERRYTEKELHEKFKDAGFRIIRSTSFVTTLLPVMLLSRTLEKNKPTSEYDSTSELKIHPILNKIMACFMKLDLLMIKIGINLPVGGSRLIIAEKR